MPRELVKYYSAYFYEDLGDEINIYIRRLRKTELPSLM